MSRNYLIAALLLIALYLMFFRARASGYAYSSPKSTSDRLMSRA